MLKTQMMKFVACPLYTGLSLSTHYTSVHMLVEGMDESSAS